jgi:hypothetical protein
MPDEVRRERARAAAIPDAARSTLGTTTKFEYCLPHHHERIADSQAGAIMTRRLGVLAAAILVGFSCSSPASAETALTESPITPGFWSFPRKPVAASDMLAACRAHLEIRFADGHFIGLRAQKRDLGLTQREVESVGRCSFDRDKQLDTCEIRNIHADGSILAGVLTIKYTLDPKGDAKAAPKTDAKTDAKADAKSEPKPDAKRIAKILVTPKMITDSPVDNAPYEAFPVRCPDDAVWTIFGETAPPK